MSLNRQIMLKIINFLHSKKRFIITHSIKYNSTAAASNVKSLDYCINLVRKLDHDNFVSSLLLEPKLRSTAFAIRALNVELSKIQEQTTEHHTGALRLKFWEDSLDSIFDDKPPDHPVLLELHKATKRHNLSKLLLKRLLTARSRQLNVSTFKDMTDMENYADHTCSSVLMLLLEATNVTSVDCDHVASHVGRAQGLTNLIRSLPYNLKEKVVLLPRTELLKHGVSEESLMRNSVDPGALSDIVFEIASRANSHIKVADSLKHQVPGKCRNIFLPAVPVRLYLKNLEKAKFSIYAPELNRKNGLLPYILLWNRITGQQLALKLRGRDLLATNQNCFKVEKIAHSLQALRRLVLALWE